MKIYSSYTDYDKKITKTIVTIGSFDGFHLGHQKICNDLVYQAKKNQLESTLLTFFPHPRMVLQEKTDIKLLHTINEKARFFEKSAIDNLVIQPFTEAFSNLSAEEFVKQLLVDTFNISKIIIGYDHRFGKNRQAGIDDLILLSKKYNFEVEQISATAIDAIAVSSSKIRTELLNGNVKTANAYLGYNYLLTGLVVKGNQLGRTIGFPTANIDIQETYKLIPKNGVYMVQSTLNNTLVFGIMNIGNRPTVNGTYQTIEIHFLDFNQDIYGQEITIEVLNFIRDEQKFDSLNDLKNQIEKDKQTAIHFFSKK